MRGVSGFQLKQGGPEVYELCWVSAQMGQCADDLIAAVGVSPGERVLDVGCGTGVLARKAAVRTGVTGIVTGTDVSEGMIAAAVRFAGESGLDGISWMACDAADMPLADASFDVVLCQQGLQFMPDKSGAMAEMARVLKPGGRLGVTVWRIKGPLGAAFTTVLDKHFGAGTTAPWEMVYALGDRGRLHDLAAAAGLRETHVSLDVKFARHADPQAFITGAIAGSPLAGTMADLPQGEHARLIAEIVAELADYHDDDGLAAPVECLTLTARKKDRADG